MRYKACVWWAADGQSHVILTDPRDREMPDEWLRRDGIREAMRVAPSKSWDAGDFYIDEVEDEHLDEEWLRVSASRSR